RTLIDSFKGRSQSFALLIIKIMQLNDVNETFGFQQGDKVLVGAARRLCESFGSSGEVFKVGDSEFSVLLPAADLEVATRHAQRVVSLFQDQSGVSEYEQYTGVSVGVAVYPGHGTEPELLIRRARAAMSEARRTGRDYAVFSSRLDEECSRRLELTARLRDSISTGQLLLYCQPKLRLENSTFCGAEALVRWQYQDGEMVPPSEFVPLAELVGLITPLTHWVLETAFRQRFAWHEVGIDFPLSVNLSAQDLYDPRLVGKVEGLMATWGGEGHWIKFEVTESGMMKDPLVALEAINKMRSMGIGFSIDDFGVGYSSLSYLRDLPVDEIKIDQSFVKSMLDEPEVAAIIKFTIEMAHHLNLEVVAEGVENEAEKDYLTMLGCDVIQGYYVSAPMPIEEFNDWLLASVWQCKK
ncbi:bifunctional diguanylate cyclase/phosphodiesterase, partial [Pseudomonas sp. CrR25]|nr:bifunctional diguanylate cyclase/phosphodiesterase [Pseudomonas sp. CrR25]